MKKNHILSTFNPHHREPVYSGSYRYILLLFPLVSYYIQQKDILKWQDCILHTETFDWLIPLHRFEVDQWQGCILKSLTNDWWIFGKYLKLTNQKATFSGSTKIQCFNTYHTCACDTFYLSNGCYRRMPLATIHPDTASIRTI